MIHTRRILAMIVIMILPLLLAGCWDNREIDSLFILTGTALDVPDNPDQVAVSLQVAKIEQGQAGSGESSGASGSNSTIMLHTVSNTMLSAISQIKEKASLTTIISNKVKGEVIPKSDYIIFLSHSSADKYITDFIYELLKKRGAKQNEFFYSSRSDTVDQYDSTDSLGIQIKNNIVKENALLVYLTSNPYKDSEFCMFEGGAGWATRSVGEYIVLSLTYPEIPKFITNGKLEFCIEDNKSIKLDRKSYLFILKMLNRMIDHLNAGRRANADVEISLFPATDIPSDLQLLHEKKALEDYMDHDIKEHWDFYVTKNLDAYTKSRYPDSD